MKIVSTREGISQSNIKNENTRAIFGEIAGAKGISRASISEKTGLSLMTVGKVADMLTKEGLVTQVKPARGSAGRRAGMLAISDKFFILTMDISGAKFRASILDMSLCAIDSLIYPYNESLFPEDNLIIFFRETGTLLMKHLMDKKLIGSGICLQGDYDSENDILLSSGESRLLGLKIADIMKKSLGFAPTKITSSSTAAAASEMSELPPDKRDCVISLTIDEEIHGCISLLGRTLKKPSDFGALLCENGKTLRKNKFIAGGTFDEEEFCRQLSFALKPLIYVLCPDAIFISSPENKLSDWFPELMEKEFSALPSPPEIFFETGKSSRSDMGVAMMIREEMLATL